MKRCLPILGASRADPVVWSLAVRTRGMTIGERLGDDGGALGSSSSMRTLLNDVYGDRDALADGFAVDAWR